MASHIFLSAICFVIAAAPAFSQENQVKQSDIDFFETKIRPILSDHCSECHSATSDPVRGEFVIDSRASILAGGETGPAIVSGEPEKSLLIDAVNYRGLYEMPPDSKLPQNKIDLLEEWVLRGAPWPDHGEHATENLKSRFDLKKRVAEHWAWQPIQVSTPPDIQNSDWQNWPLDPIDNFILKRLDEKGLAPAKESSKSTWIRRVYLDLTGLPPTPEDIATFIADDSDDAYEKVVDRQLESPGFGERWARHWMDLVRYAETYGHEFDFPIAHAWQYRDYLIRALNNDLPYDDFIREQLAGDLLDEPRSNPEKGFNESIIGTGFWFLGEATHGPVDVRADEAGRIDNQIDVLCKTFLGLTVACARCHDHKFDAISAEDYYALSGFLQSSRRQMALLDPEDQISTATKSARKKAKLNNDLVDMWLQSLTGIEQDEWLEELSFPSDPETELASTNRFDFSKILESQPVADVQHPFHLLRLASLNDKLMIKFQVREVAKAWEEQAKKHKSFMSASLVAEDFSRGIPDDWFKYGWAFEQPQTPFHFSANGNVVSKDGLITTARLGAKFQGAIRSPTFEITHDKIAIRVKSSGCQIRLIIDGYEMDIHNPLLFNGCKLEVNNATDFTWVLMEHDIKNYKGHRAYLEFLDHGDRFLQIDEIRFLNNDDPDPANPPSQFAKLILDKKPVSSDEIFDAAADAFKYCFGSSKKIADAEYCRLVSLLAENSLPKESTGTKLRQARDQFRDEFSNVPQPMNVIAATDGTPEDEHLFIRGNAQTLGDKIRRRFLTALSSSNGTQSDTLFQNGSGRLDLANQIASADNPLTSRVIVNRIWRHIFGEGIVASVDNFGVLGQQPSHPRLLDYLSTEFCNDDWSLKRFIRRLVLTRTYRMSSTLNPAATNIDPDNRLLHRANVKRLEGEAIRDSMLFVAGTLDRKMFGPGVPVHLTEFMQGRGRPKKSGPLDGDSRRSVYIEVRRNFLSPMMLAFDTPIPFNTIGDRHQSNVPAQALILMNDPFVVAQASHWARHLLKATNDRRGRIEIAFEQAFGRPPTQQEFDQLDQFFVSQAGELGIPEKEIDTSDKLWRDFCHVVFNMKEFIYIK